MQPNASQQPYVFIVDQNGMPFHQGGVPMVPQPGQMPSAGAGTPGGSAQDMVQLVPVPMQMHPQGPLVQQGMPMGGSGTSFPMAYSPHPTSGSASPHVSTGQPWMPGQPSAFHRSWGADGGSHSGSQPPNFNSSVRSADGVRSDEMSASGSRHKAWHTASPSASTRDIEKWVPEESDFPRWGFALVDAKNAFLSRVPIAPNKIKQVTKGVAEYLHPQSSKPCHAICTKYVQQGTCPQEAACPNFHVDPAYVEAARSVPTTVCCGLHDDYFTKEVISHNLLTSIPKKFFLIFDEDKSEVELGPLQIAFTVGLEGVARRGDALLISAKRNLCRLHLEGRCRWTKDCSHVHVCRQMYKFLKTFHYPSLVFLLETDPNYESIASKITGSAKLMNFVSSDCSQFLLQSLLDLKKVPAVKAMLESSANFTPAQKELADKLVADKPAE